MKRVNENSLTGIATGIATGPAQKKTRVTHDKKTLCERMRALRHTQYDARNASVTNSPKVILVSTGSDAYNKETMSMACYDRYGQNVWTIADCFVEDVKIGDIVMVTASGEDNYNSLHKVTGIQYITRDVYQTMYKPIKTISDDQKDYRNYVMTLGDRCEISIPKNLVHAKLGFKGIQCMHPLIGHFTNNLSSTSVPFKWCEKNNIPVRRVIHNYKKLRSFCIKNVY